MQQALQNVAEERSMQDLVQMGRMVLEEIAEKSQCRLAVLLLNEASVQRCKELLFSSQPVHMARISRSEIYLGSSLSEAFQRIANHSLVILMARVLVHNLRIEAIYPDGK